MRLFTDAGAAAVRASSTRAGVRAAFASGTMTMSFSPVREFTRMWATPVAPSTSMTQRVSTPSARRARCAWR